MLWLPAVKKAHTIKHIVMLFVAKFIHTYDVKSTKQTSVLLKNPNKNTQQFCQVHPGS